MITIFMNNHFGKLGIKPEFLEIIEREGFSQPTSIQNRAIPQILLGKDVVGTAATGSGKTLAYCIPMLQKVEKGGGLQGVVLVPTRELAKQVYSVFQTFSENKSLNILLSYGGGAIKSQKDEISLVDVLILTPGRLIEFLKEDIVEFSNLKMLVLDEADSMFQSQFFDEMDFILHNMPRKKQVLLFSATISKEVYMKVKKWLKNPLRITIEKYVSPKKLKQTYYQVEANQKLSLLSHLLKMERAGLSLVFTNRQDTAEFLAKNIRIDGIIVKAIHGDMAQGKRNRIIKEFSEQKFDVLISTDIAARGLDIEGITHIYNYNIPKHDEKYIHRIGRTARMGESGKVINFISKDDILPFVQVMRAHDISLLRKDLPEFEEVVVKKDFSKKKYRAKSKLI